MAACLRPLERDIAILRDSSGDCATDDVLIVEVASGAARPEASMVMDFFFPIRRRGRGASDRRIGADVRR